MFHALNLAWDVEILDQDLLWALLRLTLEAQENRAR